jgi:hypothetical protein
VVSGYRPALAVSAGLSLVGAVTAMAVSRRKAAAATPPATVADPAELQTARS